MMVLGCVCSVMLVFGLTESTGNTENAAACQRRFAIWLIRLWRRGWLVEGTAIPTRCGMCIASLLLCFFLELTNTFVPTVLRGKCLSVDEPIQGSTPALAILGSLITPTPKCSLIIGVVGTIAVSVRCTVLRAGCPRSQLASNTDSQ